MQSAPLAVYRLADGFSATANPNGPWQIGFSASPSLASDQFRLAQYADISEPIVLWHPAKPQGNGPGYYPYVGFTRRGKRERLRPRDGRCVPAPLRWRV